MIVPGINTVHFVDEEDKYLINQNYPNIDNIYYFQRWELEDEGVVGFVGSRVALRLKGGGRRRWPR